jgi:hypothetical protein
MSAITNPLPKPVDNFSTQISSATISPTAITFTVEDATGLPTEGVGVFFKKDSDGQVVTGSVEFIHWTGVSSNTITLTDVNDRGLDGSDSGAQSYVAGDFFEVWVTSYYYQSQSDALLNEHDTGGEHDISAMITNGSVLDEDDMASNSATALATQQSIKAYVDNGQVNSLNQQAIINGNFDVWQRGTSGATPDFVITFMADRWSDYPFRDGGTLPTLTRSRQLLTSGDIPNAFYYSRLATDGAGTSLGNNSQNRYSQTIEHGTRLLCGNGKKVTLSFWARSSIANKKIQPVIIQNYGSGGSPSSAEFIVSDLTTLTSTWTKYTYTFTTNTLVGKTFGTDNDDLLQVAIYYQWGSTRATSVGLTGTETYVGAGNIDIAQVQLNAGEVALPFQPKSYGEELRACQRYFHRHNAVSNYGSFTNGFHRSTTESRCVYRYPVEMRANPTITTNGNLAVWQTTTAIAVTGVSIVAGSNNRHAGELGCTVASGLTAGQGTQFSANNDTSAYIQFQAEL